LGLLYLLKYYDKAIGISLIAISASLLPSPTYYWKDYTDKVSNFS